MSSINMCFLICFLVPCLVTARHDDKRKVSCDTLCKITNFPGSLGGCSCNHVLWTTVKRSSEIRDTLDAEAENLQNFRHTVFGNMDSEEETESDKKRNSQSEAARKLIELLKSRAMQPIIQDLDF